MKKIMFFSIIIPTYNEEKDIRATLDNLVALDYPDFEVFVVDDSTDKTPEIVKEYAEQGIVLVKPGGGGRCEARNIGIQKAKGEVVCILNADVHLPKDFLHKVKKHYLEGADYVLVAAKVKNDDKFLARYIDCVAAMEYDTPELAKNFQWTEGFTCRKGMAIKAGLFPTNFVVPMCAGEDGYFGENLRKIGAKKILDKGIIVEHIAPDNLKEYWDIRKGRGRGYPQVYRFLRKYPYWKIAFKAFLKTGWSGLLMLNILWPLFFSFKISRYSFRGKKDIPLLILAWYIECFAFIVGMWTEFFKIRKKECSAKA